MRPSIASQFFIVGIEGTELNKSESKLIESGLGGVVLFKRNISSLDQVVRLNSQIINANLKNPPLICVDQEGGRVQRLKNIFTDIPPMGRLKNSLLANPNLAFRLGAMMGRELCVAGFHLNFAPCLDVLQTKTALDAIIGDRSFSEDPKEVALLGEKFIKGMQSSGIAACAKHFPGHGATSIDSHFNLPTLAKTQSELLQTDLRPFMAAIANNVASIMTAHIRFPNICDYPATLSRVLISQLLRDKLGFNQLIISDDLDMKALADHFSLEEILELGLNAGLDLYIIGNDFEKSLLAIETLDRLISQSSSLFERAQKSLERITRIKKTFIGKPLAPNILEAKEIVGCKPHLDLIHACL